METSSRPQTPSSSGRRGNVLISFRVSAQHTLNTVIGSLVRCVSSNWIGLVANTADAENEIVGEALVALKHEELTEMNIMSVGHRITILKGVYDVKVRQGVPIESDHYIPPCQFPRYIHMAT